MSAIAQTTSRSRSRGFSLVEILIVVVILGILAAIAVPKLSNASQIARESTLKDDLRFLRTQIQVYRSHHRDVCPGYPNGDMNQTPTGELFVQQLINYTDEFGTTSPTATATHKFGPYLTRMPENPVNAKLDIKIVGPGEELTPDGTTGWLYQPSTGQIMANLVGIDSESKSFSKY